MLKIWFPACLFITLLFFTPSVPAETGHNQFRTAPSVLPFKDGEKLTYEISWSNIMQAGTAVMEVRKQTDSDGKEAYHLVSTAVSAGLVSKFYRVSDRIESLIDPAGLSSLSYRMDSQHGKRTKKRQMLFDRSKRTVRVLAGGFQNVYTVPDGVQDALSSLYYVRTRQDFLVGKPIIVHVHEDDKTWAVAVETLGRETIRTPLGEFKTIKVRTYPQYDGVFQNKSEIFIWLTDDTRKIPVLMKSTIAIGTIVTTLVDLRTGEEKNDITYPIKATVKNH